jgi:hypothetical protein
MGFGCRCQLSRKLSDYVYAPVNTLINDEFEPNTIMIFPKRDFHWDGGLGFLDLPETLCEVCEGFFEYEENIDIKELMKELGIEYNQNLYDVWNDEPDTECLCDACIYPEKFPRLVFSGDETIEKCSNDYRHILKN